MYTRCPARRGVVQCAVVTARYSLVSLRQTRQNATDEGIRKVSWHQRNVCLQSTPNSGPDRLGSRPPNLSVFHTCHFSMLYIEPGIGPQCYKIDLSETKLVLAETKFYNQHLKMLQVVLFDVNIDYFWPYCTSLTWQSPTSVSTLSIPFLTKTPVDCLLAGEERKLTGGQCNSVLVVRQTGKYDVCFIQIWANILQEQTGYIYHRSSCCVSFSLLYVCFLSPPQIIFYHQVMMFLCCLVQFL